MLKLRVSLFKGGSRRALSSLLLTAVLLGSTTLPICPPVFAQQREESIARLKEIISAMEAVEKSDGTPERVKEVNESFLRVRRAQLQDALRREIEGLRNYASTLKSSLNVEDQQSVENSIRELESELRQLESRMGGTISASTAAQPVAAQPAARVARTARSGAVSEAPSRVSGFLPAVLRDTGSSIRPGDDASSLALNVSSAPPVQPAPIQSDCYPNAPVLVVEAATEAADLIVSRDDPTRVSDRFSRIFFSAISHAVSVDALDVERERRDLINRIETARLTERMRRTDKQIGASARSEGSTSAAEKPGFAELLGFAIEHGAVQKEVNGTTLTLSSSPYALIAAGSGDNSTTYARYGYLSRLGLSANFNISDENNVLASAKRNQLSDWTARLRLTDDRTQRSTDAEAIWGGVSEQFSEASRVETGELANLFQDNLLVAGKRREIADQFLVAPFSVGIRGILNDASLTPEIKRERIAKAILCQMKTAIFDQVRSGALRIDAASRSRIVNVTIPKFAAALEAKNKAIKRFEDGLKELRYKPVFTFAYTNKRDPEASDYSNLKFLYEKKNTENWNFIANAGLSLYHKPDPMKNQQRVRDFAAAFSFEGEAGRSPFVSPEFDQKITFALTGRYQRMMENRGVANKKADIAVAQFKLNIPIFTGATLPFSITYANATEFVKEDHVRANFGFTLDTDKIFQLLQLNKLKQQ